MEKREKRKIEVNFDLKLSKSQKETYDLIHNYRYKFITVVFSRQSGKTVLMECLCIEWLMKSNHSIAYVCRNFTLAKKLYRELTRLIPAHLVKTQNGADFYIEMKNGSTLNFYSAEQGSSLRGQTFTHMILDEFAFHKQQQTDGTHLWNDILSPTLKARGQKCIFVSTPLGKNNIFHEMYERGLSDEFPRYASILKTIYDDGFIQEEEIEEIKKSIPELSFRQEYLCEWIEEGQSFLVGYSDCFDYDVFEEDMTWIGVDLSGDGSDATILTKMNSRNEVIQYEIKGTLDMKYREIASIINNSVNLQMAYLENNGLGAPMILEISKLVKNKSRLKEWTTTNASKEEIVSRMALDIANRDIHFRRGDMELYKELGDFTVSISKNRKMTFSGRNSSHDDRVMSACICLQAKHDYDHKFTRNLASVIRL